MGAFVKCSVSVVILSLLSVFWVECLKYAALKFTCLIAHECVVAAPGVDPAAIYGEETSSTCMWRPSFPAIIHHHSSTPYFSSESEGLLHIFQKPIWKFLQYLTSYHRCLFCWLAFAAEIDFPSVLFFTLAFICAFISTARRGWEDGDRFLLQRGQWVWTLGTIQPHGHIYRKRESIERIHSPATHSVCKSLCPSAFILLTVAKRHVPFLLFTLPHAEPPSLCTPLFVAASASIVPLYLCLLQP